MKPIERLRALDAEAKLVEHIGAMLGWDQETYMPSAAIDERSDQLALMESLTHDMATSPEIGSILAELGSNAEAPGGPESLPTIDRAYLRVMRRKFDQATKLPSELVSEMAKATSLSQAAWVQARKDDDYRAFAPHLSKMLEFNKTVAACLDPGKRPYDVLLDQFEEGAIEAQVASVFSALRDDLVSLLDRILGGPQVDDSFLRRNCPAAAQAKASAYFMKALAFDATRGRLDTTAHPFTTTLGGSDVRITTRYVEEYFPSSVFSTIHETGHALYELGLDPSPDYRRTSLAEASSMAIHESQSRLWENTVGRSLGFWLHHLPALRQMLSPVLDGVGLEDFYRAINKVEPSLIRTEADEVTYSLHVILRFELEGALVSGDLSVDDLPGAWNDGMKRLLGVVPTDDAHGCLQDIHWSMGSFGYFPSYALGNLYGAQWWDAMKAQGLDPKSAVEQGNLGSILSWLRTNIHKPGAIYKPGELVEHVTGNALDPSHFVRYLNDKYAGVYGF
ncbi:MAG: carboxypeptidase [Spirochaetae bacterium HGW-Spirochaetae-7]|jgi:carboxypeptidase Taq|nr:MAG: carboxypeptidase [Spirochaetae bacterium HGW-Spirochaetae-7]